jgi:hypothetical protein
MTTCLSGGRGINSTITSPDTATKPTFHRLAIPRCRDFTHRVSDLPILIAHAHKAHRNFSSGPRRAQRICTSARHGTIKRGTDDDRLGTDRGKTVDVCAQV